MKYKEVGFRAVYHNFVIVRINNRIKDVLKDLPVPEDANAVLTYGYYDREAGITLEILAAALLHDDGSFKYTEGFNDSMLKLRIGAVEDEELMVCSDEDGKLSEEYAEKLDALHNYDASEEVENTRQMRFLDQCRHEWFIDDIKVRLLKENLEIEECWVRITGLGDHYFIGTLLNEPNQDYGWHQGDTIAFNIHKSEDGEITCFSDMNPSVRITEEDLADGSMLKESVKKFNEERNEENFLDVLEILRDSYVWVPCSAIFSEEDSARIEEMIKAKEDDLSSLAGDEFVANDQVRLVPDILQNGDKFFFPVFSSAEEMGEYGNNFSKVQKHILEVIPLARNNDKDVAGIVLNAFSEPFVLENTLFDIIEKMKSRISSAN